MQWQYYIGCRLAVQVRISARHYEEVQAVEPYDHELQQPTDEYYSKKNQSSNVFIYIIEADKEQLNETQICLEWMKQNLSDYVMNRREFLNEIEKRMFFHALLQLTHSQENRLEMLEMSLAVKTKMLSSALSDKIQEDREFK